MRTLFFDTETTGKWNFKDSFYGVSQPGLCQLGAILYEERRVVAEVNLIVKPLGAVAGGGVGPIKIPQETSDIHGITDEMAEALGFDYKVVLPMFNNLLKRADRVVAFNTSFDRDVMKCAFNRIAAPQDELTTADWKCAMLSSAPAVGLPGKYGDKYGWPKLQAAYQKLVDPAGFDGAHNAMADVRATADVFFKLEDGGFEIFAPKGK